MRKVITKIFSTFLIVAIALSIVGPVKVNASASTNTLTITFRTKTYSSTPGSVQYSVDGGNTWTTKEYGTNVNAESITVTGNNLQIKIVPNNGFSVDWAGIGYSEDSSNYNFSNNANSSISGGLLGSNGYYASPSATHVKLENVEFSEEEGGFGSAFDGKTYLIWSCSNKLCFHYFDDMDPDETNYIKASTITDDYDQNTKFDVNANTKFFADDEDFENWALANGGTDYSWRSTNPSTLQGPDGIDYPPVGEPYIEHAYVSYADRNFKAIIYDDVFKAVTMGPVTGLSYYPGSWTNDLIRQDSYNIGGTTKDKPAVIKSMILEPIVNIVGQNFNGLNIQKIEALDVPKDAVTITKVDNVYRITFASRFYDKVVFKITDVQGKEYYLMIHREAITARIDHDNKTSFIDAGLYYNRNTSYTDYKVTAKIVYKNGKVKIVELKNAKHVDDGLGNSIEDYEVDSENPQRNDWPLGKGIKQAGYRYDISEDEIKTISKIYVNAEFKGSTATNYAGAFAGSGQGAEIEM